MRRTSLILVAILSAVFVLLPAAPAAAVATSITISGPSSVEHGTSTVIFGVLRSGRSGIAGQTVILNRSVDGENWTLVGLATTGSTGTTNLSTPELTETTHFRWSYGGNVEFGYEASTSAVHTVEVPPATGQTQSFLNIQGPDGVASGESAELATRLTFSSPLSGVQGIPGRTVSLNRSIDGDTWTHVGSSLTDADGRAMVVDPALTTTTRYQWAFEGDETYTGARSPNHTVVVTEPDPEQAPTALTIHTDPAWIRSGQGSVLRTALWSQGTRVGGANVVLRESIDGGETWTTVADRTTDDLGQASAVVTPLENTLYQWRFPGTDAYRWSASPSAGVTINDEAPTRLTMQHEPSPHYPDQTITLVGVLSSDAGPRPYRPVALEWSTDGGATFSNVADLVTDSTGTVRWPLHLGATGSAAFRWTFEGTQTLSPAMSAPTVITVLPSVASKLSMSASDSSIITGQKVTLETVLRSGGEPRAGQTVELYGTDWLGSHLLGSAVTDSEGRATVAHRPVPNTTYRWKFAGAVGIAASQSSQLSVRVAFAVTAGARSTGIQLGKKIVVTGTVWPFISGTTVELIRKVTTGTRVLVAGKVGAEGRFSLRVEPRRRGSYHVYVRASRIGTRQSPGQSRLMVITVG